jgi:nucleoside-diphosphate-sugar epimerase
MERTNAQQPADIAAALASLDRPVHLLHAASSTERLDGQDLDESDYSRTKHAGTVAVSEVSARTGWPLTIARIHNTYGPGQPATRFVAAVVAALRAGEPVVLAHPDRVRDFVYVDDVARSLVATLDEAAGGRPEIGTGTGTRLEAVARLVARTVGAPESLVVRGRPSDVPDLHLATVCPIPFGSFGLCRTVLPDGIRLMTEAR